MVLEKLQINFDFYGPPPIFGTRYENLLCAKILLNLKTPQPNTVNYLNAHMYFIRKNHNANQSLLKSIYKGPQIDFDSLIAALNFTEGIRFKSTIKTINMQLLLVSY